MATFISVLLLISTPASSQSAPATIPENAQGKSYGSGWECDAGYRVEGNTCAKVVVPENAFPTNRTYGAGWACHHGFQKTAYAECAEVIVPNGGYLDQTGEWWRCLRGYKKVDDTCLEIALPDNAYLIETTFGSSWACDRGFEATADACLQIAIPENAYLNASNYGRRWTCDRGFFEVANKCAPVAVPKNAYFDDASYGIGWKCDRGFVAESNGCLPIDIPQNAHLDRSGNRWECNKNFQKTQTNLCVVSK